MIPARLIRHLLIFYGNHIDVKIHAGYPRKPYSRIDVVEAKICATPWPSQAGLISITFTNGSSELRAKPVFQRLRVEGNTVEGGSGPYLVVSSAEDASEHRCVDLQMHQHLLRGERD